MPLAAASASVLETPLGIELVTYGLMVCLPIRLLAETGTILLLALEPALKDMLEGLSGCGRAWLNELMLRS